MQKKATQPGESGCIIWSAVDSLKALSVEKYGNCETRGAEANRKTREFSFNKTLNTISLQI